MSWQKALKLSQIEPETTRRVALDEESILICRADESQVFAIEDRCSHDGGILEEGKLDGPIIECPRHGARFDITSGKAVRMPAVASIQTYHTRVSDDGWIEVEMEDD